MSNWTPDLKKALTVLWLRGDSCSMIALELNRAFGVRLSRNAVIGKVTRMGLPSRKVPVRAETARSIAARIRAKRIPTPEEGLMTYAEHRDFRDCAMFCEGESGSKGFVCGEVPVSGSVYCARCIGIVYDLAALKRSAA